MSLQKRHGRFAAWIEIDGQRAEEFGSGVHGRTEICLVRSRIGAEVAIYAQEFPSTTSASACADVFLDGVHVGKSVLSPSQGPRCFAGSWTDEESLRPFIFSLAKNNDKQCLSEDAGKIEIRISEIILLYGVDEDENLYILPEPIEEWEPSSVVEQDEMERHIIVLADFTQQRKYNPQWQFQKFHSTPFDCHKPEPIANFEFIYGPEEFVSRELNKLDTESLGTRRPDEFQAFSNLGPQSRLDEHTNHESCKARTTSGQLKKRTRSCDTYDGWSSCGSDPECTRCADAGVDCIPRGGRSKICQRCARWRRGCDLPRMVEIAEKKKRRKHVKWQPHMRINKSKRRNRPRTARNNDKSVWCESSSSDTESEVEGLPDSCSIGMPGQSQPVHFQRDHSQDASHSVKTDHQDKTYRETEVVMPTDTSEVREAEIDRCNSAMSLDHTEGDRMPDALMALSDAETAQESNRNVNCTSRMLQMATDAIMDLLRECDRLSRRLRGSIAQVEQEENGE